MHPKSSSPLHATRKSARSPGRKFAGSVLLVAFGATSLASAQQAPAAGAPSSGSSGTQGTTSGPLPGVYGLSGGSTAGQSDINSYLPSSSRPVSEKGDSFDLNRSSGQMMVTGGNGTGDGGFGDAALDTGTLTIAGAPQRGAAPEFHVVKQGDTLWAISNNYFQNPWEWPRVWSLNPQVENPHWIYPGDQLRLANAQPSSDGGLGNSDTNVAPGRGFVGAKRSATRGTVFLRDQGYIGDPERDVWGEVVGGLEEKQMLSAEDTVYLQMKDDVDLRLGQRLTVFREVRSPETPSGAREPDGELVKVYGTVRIDGWDKDSHIARGKLVESMDVIERGAKVGPVGRRFDVVPPKAAKQEIEARLLTSIYPHLFFGSEQVIFIDRGKEDGLEPGNRLKALRRGDTWRRTLDESSAFASSRVPMDSPETAPAERTPTNGDEESFPDEVVAEVMVLRVEDYSATCVVVEAKRPLEPGERLATIKGY